MWMINQLKLNKDINLYNNGSPYRDVMHVKDVCRAIKLVIDTGELNTIYNIGSGYPTQVGEIINFVKDHINSKSQINTIEPPEFHKNVQVQDFWMDVGKIKSLGFVPEYTLEEGLKNMCQ